MIQRIQSIFLAISALTLGLLFKFPFATSNEAAASFLSDQQFNIQDHPALMGLAGLGVAIAIVTIFLFKNRSLQMRLTTLVVVLSILLVIFSAILFLNESKEIAKSVQVDDGIGIYLPILAIIFGVLASRFIKKDDKTVKSMDRLR